MSSPDNLYETKNHCKFRILIHLILVVKYRKPLLQGQISDTLKTSMREIEVTTRFRIEEMEVDRDHLHILIRIEPQYSISQYVRRIKQWTTQNIWKRHPWLKRTFWKEQSFWSDGYFVCSVGDASVDTIRRYIQEQG